ncbi:hypothetical protein ACSSS7_000761 [Eimeria intestinalis]
MGFSAWHEGPKARHRVRWTSLLCFQFVVFLLTLDQTLLIGASKLSSSDLNLSSLIISSSRSSSSSQRSRVHRVVVSKLHEISDGSHTARLEVSLQAPTVAAAPREEKRSSSSDPNLVKGYLTATLRGTQLEIQPPLFDVATLLDAMLKEAEAVGAQTVLSAHGECNMSAFVGHVYAGFSPVLSGGESQQDSSTVVWTAEASRIRRHQQRLKPTGKSTHSPPPQHLLPLSLVLSPLLLLLPLLQDLNFRAYDLLMIAAMNHRGDILQALVPLSGEKRASSLGVSLELVGPRGSAVGSELLAGLATSADADELAGVVLAVRANDASGIYDAVEAGLLPVSLDRETINFSAGGGQPERMFPYTLSTEGESSEEEAQVGREAQRETGEEGPLRAAAEARQRARNRWGELLAQLKARGLIGGFKETPQDAGGVAVAGDVRSLSLHGVGMGVATVVLLTLLVLGMVPKRRRPARTAAGSVGLGLLPHAVHAGGQALQGGGEDDFVGVEATRPANGSEKLT